MPLKTDTSPYVHGFSSTAPLTFVHLFGLSQDRQKPVQWLHILDWTCYVRLCGCFIDAIWCLLRELVTVADGREGEVARGKI